MNLLMLWSCRQLTYRGHYIVLTEFIICVWFAESITFHYYTCVERKKNLSNYGKKTGKL